MLIILTNNLNTLKKNEKDRQTLIVMLPDANLGITDSPPYSSHPWGTTIANMPVGYHHSYQTPGSSKWPWHHHHTLGSPAQCPKVTNIIRHLSPTNLSITNYLLYLRVVNAMFVVLVGYLCHVPGRGAIACHVSLARITKQLRCHWCSLNTRHRCHRGNVTLHRVGTVSEL